MGLSPRKAAAIPDSGVLALSTMEAPGSDAAAPPLVVERVAFRALPDYYEAWSGLCARALAANVFLEPAFALPLLQHAARRLRPDVLFVWEENGPTSFGRLVGLIPLDLSVAKPVGATHAFNHEQVCLGAPLLDRDRAHEALDAAFEWLSIQYPRIAALTFSLVPEAFTHFLEDHWTTHRLASFERAVYRKGSNTDPARLVSRRHRKEIERQQRRLSEHGPVAYRSASTPEDIMRAAEMYLAIEHNGWKGSQGSTLLANPGLATFTRTMTRLMAYEGKCRIDWIEVAGRPVAMGIVLTANGRAHFWKTAFDETFASLSPGVQFALQLTLRQSADDTVYETDSCADPHHPMIERFWHDRAAMNDVLIALAPATDWRWKRAVAWERGTRAARHGLKRVAKRTGLLDLLRGRRHRAEPANH